EGMGSYDEQLLARALARMQATYAARWQHLSAEPLRGIQGLRPGDPSDGPASRCRPASVAGRRVVPWLRLVDATPSPQEPLSPADDVPALPPAAPRAPCPR